MKIEIKRVNLPELALEQSFHEHTLGYKAVLKFTVIHDTRLPIIYNIEDDTVPQEKVIKNMIRLRIREEFYGDILKDLHELEFRILAKHPVNWEFKEDMDRLVEKIDSKIEL